MGGMEGGRAACACAALIDADESSGRCREAVSAGLGIRSSPPSPKSTRLPPTFLPPSVHLPPSFPLLQWPTFPQVYINGEFFGGADIVMASAQVGLMGGGAGRWCRWYDGLC